MKKTRAEMLEELRALRAREAHIEAALAEDGEGIDDPCESPESRPLKALAALQEALDGAPDEATLFARTCTVVVEHAGYARAWVGLVEHDEQKSVRPVAQAGVCVGAAKAPIVWADNEHGRGPVGTAIRTGKPAVVQRTATDPSFAPWREATARVGIAAAASLPIITDGRTRGVLCVLAREEDAFGPRQIVLLVELSNSLSRACAALRARAERAELGAQLDRVLEATGVVAWSARANSNTIDYISGATERVLGYPGAELMGKAGVWRRLVSAQDAEALEQATRDLSHTGRAEMDTRVVAQDGQTRWVRTSMQVAADPEGAPMRIDGIAIDIGDRKRAEEDLLASRRYLQSVIDSLPVRIAVLDGNMTIHSVNRPWVLFAERAGYPHPDAGVGRWYRDVCAALHGEKTSACAAPAARAVLEGRMDVFETEYVCATPAGERWFNMRVAPVLSGDGPGRVVVSHLDITPRKLAEDALRRSEALFRQIVENGWQMITLGGADGRITYAAGSWEQVLGVDPAALIGRVGTGLVHPDDMPIRAAVRAAVAAEAGATGTYEVRLRHADGHYLWFDITSVNLLHEPSVRAIVTNARHVGERKRAEVALQQMNAELEQRVEDRTAELSRANEALSRASRIKDEFLAGMSHELRTPLNAVLGLSEALSEEIYGAISDRQRATIRRIEESGRHLLSLINDILDLSKIEAGKTAIELGAVDVDDLCRASLRMVQESARKKRLRISNRRRGGFGAILADERRLKQVLVNLLSNAVKFTPDGGQIGLDVSIDDAAELLEVAVWDTGIGMAKDEMDRLFQPFVQLDSGLARRHAGTGLGLALVRRLVDLHGGHVTVESEPGKGSRFIVTVPARRPAMTPSRAGMAVRRLSRALVIDDSVTDAEHLERYLAESGVEAILHASAIGAVDRAAVEGPDAIFLDILLPEEIGWDVLAELKRDPRTAHIPVVVTTVLDRPTPDVSEADDFITKPVGRARVAEALTRIATREERVAPSGKPVPKLLGRRILVAEDEETNVDTVIDYLRSRGYEVLVARDGNEALTLARAEIPNLILMDIQMPNLDGLEATRAIRSDPSPEVQRIPIIAVTALAMAGDRERCITAGADEYLTKPVGLKALAAAVEAHLVRVQA